MAEGKGKTPAKSGARPAPSSPEDLQAELLLREAEEEVRREQLLKIWQQYGTYIVAAALAIIVGIGGVQAWRARTIAAAEAAGLRFDEARRLAVDGKADEAMKSFAAIAEDGPKGYALLARLNVAAAHAKAGRAADAVKAFDGVAGDSGADPMLRDFARLQSASLRLDGADFTEMQNRLNDLAGEKSSWRYSARELLGLAAMKAGRTDEARKTFTELLADRKVPPSIGQRAQLLLAQLTATELAAAAPAAPAPVQPAASGPAKSDPAKAEPKTEPKKK